MTAGSAFALVDAFTTDRPFSGNPAGVLLLDALPDAEWMQGVANELQQAETAFLVPGDGGAYLLRWFTPVAEVALCGHRRRVGGIKASSSVQAAGWAAVWSPFWSRMLLDWGGRRPTATAMTCQIHAQNGTRTDPAAPSRTGALGVQLPPRARVARRSVGWQEPRHRTARQVVCRAVRESVLPTYTSQSSSWSSPPLSWSPSRSPREPSQPLRSPRSPRSLSSQRPLRSSSSSRPSQCPRLSSSSPRLSPL
jgi:hypothetical protein